MITGIDAWRNYAQVMSEALRMLMNLEIVKSESVVPAAGGKFLAMHGFERDRTFLGLFTSGPLHEAAVRHGLFNETALLDANVAPVTLTAKLVVYFAFRMRFGIRFTPPDRVRIPVADRYRVFRASENSVCGRIPRATAHSRGLQHSGSHNAQRRSLGRSSAAVCWLERSRSPRFRVFKPAGLWPCSAWLAFL